MKFKNAFAVGLLSFGSLSGSEKSLNQDQSSAVVKNRIQITKNNVDNTLKEKTLEDFIEQLEDQKNNESYLQSLFQKFEENDKIQKQKEFYVLFYMARLSRGKNDFSGSRTYLKRALSIVDEYHLDPEYKVKALVSLGMTEYHDQKYQTAYDIYQSVLDTYEETSIANKKHKADALNNIGGLFLDIQAIIDRDDAITSFQEAIAIGEKAQQENPDDTGIVESLLLFKTNLGRVYLDYYSEEEKDKSLQKASDIFSSILALSKNYAGNEFRRIEGDVYNNLGVVSFRQGKFKESELSLQESFRLWDLLGNQEGKALVYVNQSELYATMAQQSDRLHGEGNKESDSLYQKSREQLELVVSLEEVPSYILSYALQSLERKYFAMGEFSKAYEYVKKRESIENTIGRDEIQKMYIQQKEKERRLTLEKDKEIAEQRSQYLLALGGLLLVILIVGGYSYRKTKKQSRIIQEKDKDLEQKNDLLNNANMNLEVLNTQLSAANADLEVMNKEIIEKNKTLEDYMEDLESFFKIVGHDLRNQITGMSMSFEVMKAFVDQILHLRTKNDLDVIASQLKDVRQRYREGKELTFADKEVLFSSIQLLSTCLEDIMGKSQKISSSNEKKIQQVNHTIQYLLELQKRSQDKDRKLYFEKMNLSEFLGRSVNRMYWNDTAASKDITLLVTKEAGADDALSMDAHILKTIVDNLIGNAVKFTHKGGHIDIFVEDRSDFVQLRIKDNGVGMTEDQKQKVFSIKERTSTLGTQGEVGTGFGLPQVYQYIQKLGGTIHIKSEGKDTGTEFVINFPKERRV